MNAFGVEFHGPFMPEHRVTVDGYRVPKLVAHRRDDGTVSLVLDERFGIEGDDLEVRKWLPFLAHCMAVAAGYSCHGEQSQVINPYKVQMARLSAEPEPLVESVSN